MSEAAGASSSYPDLAYPDEFYPDAPANVFTVPVVERVMAPNHPMYRPFHKVRYRVGLTVLKDTFGNYRTVENPTEDDIFNAVTAYLGGREYVVSDEEAAALTAAGYEVIPT